MKKNTINTAKEQDDRKAFPPKMFLIIKNNHKTVSEMAAKAQFPVGCYLFTDKRNRDSGRNCDYIFLPSEADITLSSRPDKLEKLFPADADIICPGWIDPDFQLEDAGKNRNIVVFSGDRLLCFDKGKFSGAVCIVKPYRVSEIKKTISRCRSENMPFAVEIDDQDSETIRAILEFIRTASENGKIRKMDLFTGPSGTKDGKPLLFDIPVPDSPRQREKRSKGSGTEYLTKRDLIADMTGTAELTEDDTSYVFHAGSLTSVTYKDKKILASPRGGAYMQTGRKKIHFIRESSFSFESDDNRGLRECLVLNSNDNIARGRIITDYFLTGDYKGLFVSSFVQYPKMNIEYYDKYTVWETDLGIVPETEKLVIERSINGKSAPELILSENGTFSIPADQIYLKAGNYNTGIRILKKRGGESEIFTITISRSGKEKKKISIGLICSSTPARSSEFHKYSETLSFCIFPGRPQDFPGLPAAAEKEAYPARTWKRK